MNEWIETTDQKSENEKTVLLFDGFDMYTGYYLDEVGAWYTTANQYLPDKMITHWRELPDPPEKNT